MPLKKTGYTDIVLTPTHLPEAGKRVFQQHFGQSDMQAVLLNTVKDDDSIHALQTEYAERESKAAPAALSSLVDSHLEVIESGLHSLFTSNAHVETIDKTGNNCCQLHPHEPIGVYTGNNLEATVYTSIAEERNRVYVRVVGHWNDFAYISLFERV